MQTDYNLYLNGGSCYITPKRALIAKHSKKSRFEELIVNKPNFTAVLDKSTAEKYIKRIENVGFKLIEVKDYDSFSVIADFVRKEEENNV